MTPMSRRRMLHVLAACAAAPMVSGCSSIVSRPAPVKATFLLDPPVPASVGGTPKAFVVRIGAINVAAPFRGKNLVYRRSELGYEADYYSEFFVPPSMMLADAIAKGLAGAGVFERVVPAGAAGNEGDFLLEAFVSEMYGDARASPPAAVLRSTFYLSALQTLGSAPVWTHEYAERAPMDSGSAEALAQGLNRAVGAAVRDLARDLAAANLSVPR
jgi:cholesterol transport system auxiliary component